MLERGLLPDFSAAVVAETGSIANAAAASDSSLRDLRRLLWASIDNDDSLDLDQLSVAEQLPGGVVPAENSLPRKIGTAAEVKSDQP